MKKLSALVIVLSIAWVHVNAQVSVKPGVGVNFTDYSKDPTSGEYSAKGGWHIGGTVAFGKKFYFEPGLFYTVKTTEASSSGASGETSTIDLKGFRIPIGFGVNILGNEKTVVDLHGMGGVAAFFITSDNGIPETVELNKTNFGLYAGAGLDIWKLFVDFSYEWSLTNIQKDVSQVDIGKTRGLFITAGLRLNF